MASLDPSYDGCPTACTRPERDQKRGCPDCEVTRMYADCLDEIREEWGSLAEDRGHSRQHAWPWTLQKVLTDVGAVATMDARVSGQGYDDGWTVAQRRLVQLLRDERATLRRAKDFEFRRKHKIDG